MGSTLNERWHTTPVDPTSAEVLRGGGLDLASFTTSDDRYPAWVQVVSRGFLDEELTEENLAAVRERSGYRRQTGVYDPSAPMPGAPVATLSSWMGELSVPGGPAVASCAISSVTVAPTHRRRGIARAMVEGELRAATSMGVPVAMLTVSESTLYGRYGFAPAAASASWRVDVKRASWTGPVPAGRVDFIPRERARQLLPELHARVRGGVAGEVDVPDGHWDSYTGTRPDAKKPRDLRAIQYADADGEVAGVAVYSVREDEDDFTKSAVTISYLLAATDDAYAALWRFFVELDLIQTVTASELSVDEPLRWMIDDQRAATVTVRDHQYVRILDAPAALSARRFGAPGAFVLDVADPLDLAGGSWLLEIAADGSAEVSGLDGDAGGDAPGDAVRVSLGIAELSAVLLGGVSPLTLARAGRVRTTDAAAVARAFAWHEAPRLSIWY